MNESLIWFPTTLAFPAAKSTTSTSTATSSSSLAAVEKDPMYDGYWLWYHRAAGKKNHATGGPYYFEIWRYQSNKSATMLRPWPHSVNRVVFAPSSNASSSNAWSANTTMACSSDRFMVWMDNGRVEVWSLWRAVYGTISQIGHVIELPYDGMGHVSWLSYDMIAVMTNDTNKSNTKSCDL